MVVGKHQDDHFQEVGGVVGADDEQLGGIGIDVEIDDDERVRGRMIDVGVGDAMATRRSVNLHTPLSYYRTARWR